MKLFHLQEACTRPAPPPIKSSQGLSSRSPWWWEGWKHWSPRIGFLATSLLFFFAASSSFLVPLTLPRGPKCGDVGGGLGVPALPAAPGRWSVRAAQQAPSLKAHPGFQACLRQGRGRAEA